MSPRNKLLLALPIVAALVLALAYFQLFTDPVVIAFIFVLWVAVSLRNRRKFHGQEKREKA
ncbi:MAG: hypothetical protein JRN51_11095 [Nitrososphaerota archaeon]|nr:hypothetical protein [Nitrososphaerota archaeon]